MKVPKEWRISIIQNEGKSKISVQFEKRTEWIIMIRNIVGARWHYELRSWLITDNDINRELLGLKKTDHIKNALWANKIIVDDVREALGVMIDNMRSARYSESTIDS